ncbi:MAG: phosphate ABC transporter permease subunit PstC [Bacteroidales bacterium]|nr:phosphate ABC transporter permease subunit PstC [Bacteroidales bacterium]
MKGLLEKIVTGIITCSGFMTSIVILLIVVFLFSEGFGLFSQKTIEDGYSLVVNRANPVDELDAGQIKAVFDEDITDWKDVGGNAGKIMVFRFDDMLKFFSEEELGAEYEHAGDCINRLVADNPGIIGFVPTEFVGDGFQGKLLIDHKIDFGEVFGGSEWFPTATPAPQFGFLPLVLGTIWVTVFAILFALPFGLAVCIYMSEVAGERTRAVLKPVIELLNGIPSVVYGFFGLIVIVPLLQDVFGLPVGESGLAGAIVLAIMALPTIITVGEDAMLNCPRAQREASLALGASKWQTIYKVVMPYSISGITSGVVLGIGRAFGETMAVLMVTGNAAVIPLSITDPLRTIPATIAAELGEAPAGGPHYQSLFLLGVVLFFITLIINTSVEMISARQNRK